MSQPDYAGEQEVDFGRYWLAIIRRWWLPIGALIVGGVIGVLAQTGGARPYEASTSIYLGQPFAPNSVVAIQSLSTSLGFVDQIVKSRPLVKGVAARVGIGASVLQANITTQAVGVTNGAKQVGAPIAQIKVRNPSARKAVDAAAGLAAAAILQFSSYVDVKLATYQARIDRANRELAKVGDTIVAAQAEQDKIRADKSVAPTERLIVLANYNNVLEFNLSRQATLEQSLLTLRDQVALGQQVERARVITPATAHRIAAPSKRSGLAVGVVVGFLLGLLAAILWEPALGLARRARTAD